MHVVLKKGKPSVKLFLAVNRMSAAAELHAVKHRLVGEVSEADQISAEVVARELGL